MVGDRERRMNRRRVDRLDGASRGDHRALVPAPLAAGIPAEDIARSLRSPADDEGRDCDRPAVRAFDITAVKPDPRIGPMDLAERDHLVVAKHATTFTSASPVHEGGQRRLAGGAAVRHAP